MNESCNSLMRAPLEATTVWLSVLRLTVWGHPAPLLPSRSTGATRSRGLAPTRLTSGRPKRRRAPRWGIPGPGGDCGRRRRLRKRRQDEDEPRGRGWGGREEAAKAGVCVCGGGWACIWWVWVAVCAHVCTQAPVTCRVGKSSAAAPERAREMLGGRPRLSPALATSGEKA